MVAWFGISLCTDLSKMADVVSEEPFPLHCVDGILDTSINVFGFRRTSRDEDMLFTVGGE